MRSCVGGAVRSVRERQHSETSTQKRIARRTPASGSLLRSPPPLLRHAWRQNCTCKRLRAPRCRR
jgi:hypothetical protein